MADDPEAVYAELLRRAKALPYYATTWPSKKLDRELSMVSIVSMVSIYRSHVRGGVRCVEMFGAWRCSVRGGVRCVGLF